MFPCPICDVKLNSIEQKKAHCRGKNHVKRMAARDKALELGTDFDSTPDFCVVCNVPLTSKMTAIDHFKGKMHQKKVKTSEDLRQGFEHYCEVCDVKLQSLKVSEAHFNGKQHRKRERKTFTRGGKDKLAPNERKGKPLKPEKVYIDAQNSFVNNEGQQTSGGPSTWESLSCDNDSESQDPLSEFRSILSGKSPAGSTHSSNSPIEAKKPCFSFENVDIQSATTTLNNGGHHLPCDSGHENQKERCSPTSNNQKQQAKQNSNIRAHVHDKAGQMRQQVQQQNKYNNVQRPKATTVSEAANFDISNQAFWQSRPNMPPNFMNEAVHLEQLAALQNGFKDNPSHHVVEHFASPLPQVVHVLAQTIYPLSSGDIARKVGCISPSEVNTILVHLERCKIVTKSGHTPVLWALAPHVRHAAPPTPNGLLPETKPLIYPQNFTSRPETYPKDTLIEQTYYPKASDAYLAKTSQAFSSTQHFPSAILSSSPTTFVATTTTTTTPCEAMQGFDAVPHVFEANLINLLQQSGSISSAEMAKRLNLVDETKLLPVLNNLRERCLVTLEKGAALPTWRLVTGSGSANRSSNSVGVIGEERKRKSPVQNGFESSRTPSPPQQQNAFPQKIFNGFIETNEQERTSPILNDELIFNNHGLWSHFGDHILNSNGVLEQAKPETCPAMPYYRPQSAQTEIVLTATTKMSDPHGASVGAKHLESSSPPTSPRPPLQTETTQFLEDLTETPPTGYQKELYETAMQEDVVCYLPSGTGKAVVMAMVVYHMLVLNPSKQALVIVEDTVTALDQVRRLRKELSGGKSKRKKLNVGFFSGQLKQSNGKNQVIVVTSSTCLRLLNCGVLSWRDVCLLVFDKANMCANDQHSHQIVRDYYVKAKSDFRDLHVPKLLGFLDCSAAEVDVEKTVKKFNEILGNMGDIFLSGVSECKEELEEHKSESMFVCVTSNLTKEEERIFRVIHNYLIIIFENLAAQWQPLNTYRELFELSFQRHPLDGEAFAKLVRLTGQPLEKRLPANCVKIWRHYLAICEVLLALVECGENFAMELLASLKREPFGFVWANTAGLPANELSLHLLSTVPPKKSQWGSTQLHGSGIRELLEQLMIIQWEHARVSSERPLALVIVKLSKTAKTLANYLARHPELTKRNVKTTFVDGSRSSHQKAVLSAIKRRQYQVIVCTDDVEDSLDLPPCELVVLLDQPSTMAALVCLRRRQAANNVVAICREPDGEKNLKELLKQEEVVERAVDCIRGVGSSSSG